MWKISNLSQIKQNNSNGSQYIPSFIQKWSTFCLFNQLLMAVISENKMWWVNLKEVIHFNLFYFSLLKFLSELHILLKEDCGVILFKKILSKKKLWNYFPSIILFIFRNIDMSMYNIYREDSGKTYIKLLIIEKGRIIWVFGEFLN